MFRAAFTSALQRKPQAVHTKRAWLSRDFAARCPHALQHCEVYAGFILSTRPGALSSSRRTSRPQPDARISRFSPALALTFRPGAAVVPLAERVMPVTFRFSARIKSNSRASRVLVFSAQSLRRSVSRARSREWPAPPACGGSSHAGHGRAWFQAQHAPAFGASQASNVQQLTGGKCSRHGHASIDSNGLAVAGRGDRGWNRGESDVPTPGPVQADAVRFHTRRYRAGPAEPYPSGLRDTHLADVARQAADLTRLDGNDPEPLVASRLAPRRSACRVPRAEVGCHRLGEISQGLLLHPLEAGGQHGFSARAAVSCRHCSR